MRCATVLPWSKLLLLILLLTFLPSGICAAANDDCLLCHDDKDLTTAKQGKRVSLFVDIAILKGSAHGKLDCVSCHKGLDPDDLPHAKTIVAIDCITCHQETQNKLAPTASFIKLYDKSVHGTALKDGRKAATCIDCHGYHGTLTVSNSKSSVFKKNIPLTCSKCHSAVAEEYQQSTHGQAVAKGNLESPVCTDCHGEHNILKHTDPNSPVSHGKVSAEVCSPCHSSVKLSEKYGISSNRFKTFSDSYHGLAIRGRGAKVANCSSCHGVHNIKNSSDPSSTVNKQNLSKTCGSCHPGADKHFIEGKIHVTDSETADPILYWISYLYILLIVCVIGGMLLHNLIDFVKRTRIRKMKQSGQLPSHQHGYAVYVRMTFNERIQHITFALSFIVLVITGFMLRFPDAWWVAQIREFTPALFALRSLIHRIASVIMVLVSVYHIYYLIFSQSGRQLVKDLFPKFQDLINAIGMVKFNLGISKAKPPLARFSYAEKAEYWALVWGTIIMGASGLLMWIYDAYTGSFTKLQWDIARTIHYYEAWLAFLAILAWHFYFVMVNPDVYPMSMAWLHGTLSEEEMAEEHPLELERIKQSQGVAQASNSPQESTHD